MTTMKQIIIKIDKDDHQETLKNHNNNNNRKTLKVLQQTGLNKENLVGRTIDDKDPKLTFQDIKKKKLTNKACQTDKITEYDLTTDEEPSEDYWKQLALQRGEALDDSLQENQRLKDTVEALQEENKICKEMLNESRSLIEILKEMLDDSNSSEPFIEGN